MSNIADILDERKATHGPYIDHSWVSQGLKEVVREHEGWGTLSYVEKESIDMILHKIARIVNGRKSRDSWVDIQGYAKLVTDVVEEADSDEVVGYTPTSRDLRIFA